MAHNPPESETQSTRRGSGETPDTVPYQTDDEINLIDAWLVLVRQRRIMAALFLVLVFVGAAAAYLKSDTYRYTTTIEIGSQVVLQGDRPVTKLMEAPQTVKAKLENAYLSQAKYGLLDAGTKRSALCDVDVEIPRNADVILLTSEAKEATAATCKEIQRRALESLVNEHQKLLDEIKDGLRLERARLANALRSAQGDEELTRRNLTRIKEEKALVQRRLDDLETYVSTSVAHRRELQRSGSVESQAMTLLMLDGDIRQTQSQISELQNKLEIELEQKRDRLEKDLDDLAGKRKELEQEMDNLARRMENLQRTRAVSGPAQSIQPTGASRIIIVVFSVFLGLAAGIFGAFLAEFFRKARKAAHADPSG